jgi:AcrR family transcriptional regulator
MTGGATRPATERWVEILEQAAKPDAADMRDLKQDRSRRRLQDLLEAATRIFARDGIAKAKMTDVAAEAGIPVSSIYDYFPSKEDLAYEIPILRLRQLYAGFLARALEPPTMRERLRLFLTMAVDCTRQNPDWGRLLYLEIWPSVLIEEARVRKAIDDFGRIVVEMIREGARRGEWSAGIDPYRTATIIMGSLTHMTITWLLYRRPRDLGEAAGPMVDQLLALLAPAEATTPA